MSDDVLLQLVNELTDLRTRVSQLERVERYAGTIALTAGKTLTITDDMTYTASTWTPTVTQSGSVTVTVTSATYTRIGNVAVIRCALVVTGSGTTANDIVVAGLPFTAAYSGTIYTIGTATIWDSGAAVYVCNATLASTTTIKFREANTGANAGTSPAFGLANNDQISLTAVYQIA